MFRNGKMTALHEFKFHSYAHVMLALGILSPVTIQKFNGSLSKS